MVAEQIYGGSALVPPMVITEVVYLLGTRIAWLRAQVDGQLYTTAITLAEIRYGIERLPDGRRKHLLKTTADEVFSGFEGTGAAV